MEPSRMISEAELRELEDHMEKRMAKVKTDFKDAKKKLAEFKRQLKKELPDLLKGEILQSIERGVSPVKGFGRYETYSDSYQDQIKSGRFSGKRTRPVNLKLRGDLLKSLSVKPKGKGLRIIFDNFKADIHNRLGAGKSKVIRRILPTNSGEEFSRSITMRMREVLKRVAKNIFK